MPTAVSGLQVWPKPPHQEPTPASLQPSQAAGVEGAGVDCAMVPRTLEAIENLMQLRPYLATQDEVKFKQKAAHTSKTWQHWM